METQQTNLLLQRNAELEKELAVKTHELELEAALEQVRARTMAMQKSEELPEAAKLLFQQVLALGLPVVSCGYNIWQKEDQICTAWMSDGSGSLLPSFQIPLTDSPTFIRFGESRQKGEHFYTEQVSGDALVAHYRYMLSLPKFKDIVTGLQKAGFALPASQVNNVVNFSHGNLIFITAQPVPEAWNIFKRFATVFEQTFIRFLDLQKAEAQARESKIELALEKVRSRSLAMHKSDELKDVVAVVFEKLKELNFAMNDGAAIIITFIEDSKDHIQWIADTIRSFAAPSRVPFSEHSLSTDIFNAKENGVDFFSKLYPFEEKNTYFKYLFENADDYKVLPDEVKELLLQSKDYGMSIAFEKNSAIFIPTNTGKLVSENEKEILKRFAKVFEQSYIRFLDLQKAEAQSREAQIEAALEKVRSASLAMQHSSQLKTVAAAMFKRLTELGFTLSGAFIFLFDKKTRDIQLWIATTTLSEPGEINIPYTLAISKNVIFQELWNIIENGEHIFNRVYSGKEKNEYFSHVGEHNTFPQDVKDFHQKATSWITSIAGEKHAALGFDSWEGQLATMEDFKILKRFSKVFEQSYVRFLDLQKAEAQAKEAKIELGLERVRARAMAMQKTEELAALIDTLQKELSKLDFTINNCIFWIMNEEPPTATWWVGPVNKTSLPESFRVSFSNLPYFNSVLIAWKERIPKWVYKLCGKEKRDVDEYIFTETELSRFPAAVISAFKEVDNVYISFSFYNYGGLHISTIEPHSEEQLEIINRFSKVFDMTYTRFLDLQKAEAQAREAQIELALERVRAKTMAMQLSSELAETTHLLFEQLKELGETADRAFIAIVDDEKRVVELWATQHGGQQLNMMVKVSIDEPLVMNKIYTAWKQQKKSLVIDLQGEETERYFQYMKEVGIPVDRAIFGERRIDYMGCFSKGAIGVITKEPRPVEMLQLLERLAGVFDLTYTRFLDLQKAEAQAREAQIETALERVRAQAMAMRKPEELLSVCEVMYKELTALGFVEIRNAMIHTFNDKNEFLLDYDFSGMVGGRISKIPIKGFPIVEHYLKEIKKSTNAFLEIVFTGDELQAWKDTRKATGQLEDQRLETVDALYYYYYSIDMGDIGISTFSSISKEKMQVLERFRNVFQLSYQRYHDIEKAEASAREAQIQLALERIRSRSLAMHHSNELKEVVSILFQQLKNLGLEFDGGAAIYLFSEHSKDAVILVAAHNLASPILNKLPYDEEAFVNNPIISDVWNAKETGENILNRFYSFEEKNKYFGYVFKHNGLEILPQLLRDSILCADNYTASFIAEKNSLLGASSWSRQLFSKNDFDVLKRIAKAFEQAYIRFLDLQKVEAQAIQAEQDLIEIKSARKKAEDTLTELKATQAQLIQSEKMASLGELTAGIAHEIQNPLNFVNNFSEVNKEMIDELQIELKAGNTAEAIAISNDIKENEQKINHHGKRADAIVKGMLQHSRKNTGQKEPADINALCDEYLRLSYHGLRAKDKSFNADFKMNFDETIGKINIVPQDMGRVLLNLFNNAFYAVSAKKKLSDKEYKPLVSVTTKKTLEDIEIVVTDNGNGIPQYLIDKIFQPFFTTKPTGEGTGLGLSLSYDIITKEHNGTIKVVSKEGEGTTFIIQLQVLA